MHPANFRVSRSRAAGLEPAILLSEAHLFGCRKGPRVRCALKRSDTSGISHTRVAFHERVDRFSVNETNAALCPLL